MPFWPANADAMCSTLYNWVVGQIGVGGEAVGFAAAPYPVIWANQDAPYPQHPYAVLAISEPPATIGGKPERLLFDDGHGGTLERSEYDARMVITVELFSRAPLKPGGLDETYQLVNALEASLRESHVLETFSIAGLAFIDNRPPLAVPVIAGFGFERRARMALVFGVRVRVDFDNPPLLNQPNVTGTVDFQGNVTGQLQGS